MGVWLKPTFHATPLPLCHETSVCTLEVNALIRGSLPRPWGEGGRSDGGRGGRVRVHGNYLSKCPNFRVPPWKRGDGLRWPDEFVYTVRSQGKRLITFLPASYWSPKICPGRCWLGYWQCSCPFH